MRPLDPHDLASMRAEGTPHTVVDVRESWEVDLCALDGSVHLPLGALEQARDVLADKPRPLVMLCHHGVRSAHACMALDAAGLGPTLNLTGGIDAWARQIDPDMGVY